MCRNTRGDKCAPAHYIRILEYWGVAIAFQDGTLATHKNVRWKTPSPGDTASPDMSEQSAIVRNMLGGEPFADPLADASPNCAVVAPVSECSDMK
uniref:Uncharacterized protein n=1 Tax=Cupriavidus pinatubonensis (strain JMP 134 / LMG 1197) TaxID=264198 RepID=Q471F7_CUPPJ